RGTVVPERRQPMNSNATARRPNNPWHLTSEQWLVVVLGAGLATWLGLMLLFDLGWPCLLVGGALAVLLAGAVRWERAQARARRRVRAILAALAERRRLESVIDAYAKREMARAAALAIHSRQERLLTAPQLRLPHRRLRLAQ